MMVTHENSKSALSGIPLQAQSYGQSPNQYTQKEGFRNFIVIKILPNPTSTFLEKANHKTEHNGLNVKTPITL